MNFLRLGLLAICFDPDLATARRVTYDVEGSHQNAQTANILKVQEQEKAMREYIYQLEGLRHMVEILKSDVAKLKKERELDYVRMSDRISNLEKALAAQKTATKAAGKGSAKGSSGSAGNGTSTKGTSKGGVKEKKSEETSKQTKPSKITLKDRLTNVKKLIENERYTIAYNKLNDIVLSKDEKKYANYIIFYKAVCLLYLKKYDEASYNFFEVYNKNKKSELAPLALLRLAECFKKQGQVQKARIILEKAKADYPNHPLVKKTV